MHVCSARRDHPGWQDYMRKARPPPRPLRPDPTAARAELEARYPSLVRLLWQRTAKYGDGRDASVDEWERACLGVHDHAPVLTVAKATDYAARLWSKYSRRYSPYFSAVPQIVILADTESCGGARAQALHHRVLIDKRHCRPSWLAHAQWLGCGKQSFRSAPSALPPRPCGWGSTCHR